MLHQTGSGVLGPVFRAFDSPRDRLVAIKAFRLEILPEQVVRLADALRRLQSAAPVHPLIVPLLDVGLEATTPYVVMSFQPGETLDIVLRRFAPMTIDRALWILRPLAATLTSAAETGVLHGALHPRDVFVQDDEALAGVTGFGIVQALESAGLRNPLLRRPYVAPERGEAAWDRRADVFSLGVIAHELLTGRRPAPSGEQDGVFAKEMAPEHRVRLRKVLSTALAEQPGERFSSPEALIVALEDVGQRSFTAKAVAAAAVAPEPAAHPEKDLVDLPAEIIDETSSEFLSEVISEAQKPVEPPLLDVIAPPPIVPAATQADPWVDSALVSPAYGVPAGVFETSVAPHPRRTSVLAKTILYAAAGVLIGVGGGLLAARVWFAAAGPEPATTTTVEAPGAPESVPPPLVANLVDRDRPGSATTDVRPAVASGRLEVRSHPAGALVTIDGRRFGQTPVERGLAPGTYDVRVAHPGHVPRSERVTIRAASPVRTLNVTLTPGLEPTPGSSATGTPGAIHVHSRPRGARVIVDERFVGLAPFLLADVAPGDHQVRLELGGYRSATTRVRVDAGQTAALTTTLRAIQ